MTAGEKIWTGVIIFATFMLSLIASAWLISINDKDSDHWHPEPVPIETVPWRA